jgi:hypothetical protein
VGKLKPGESFVLALSGGLLAVFAVLFLLGVTHRFPGAGLTLKYYHLTPQAQRGYAFMVAQGCRQCHMIMGQGTTTAGPVLDGEGTRRSARWLTAFFNDPGAVVARTLHNGKYATAFRRYTPQEKREMVAFLEGLRSLPGADTYPAPPGQ